MPPRHACLNSGTSQWRDRRGMPSASSARSTMPRTITAPAALSVLDSVPRPEEADRLRDRCRSAGSAAARRWPPSCRRSRGAPGTRKLRPTTAWILSQELPVHSHQSCSRTRNGGRRRSSRSHLALQSGSCRSPSGRCDAGLTGRERSLQTRDVWRMRHGTDPAETQIALLVRLCFSVRCCAGVASPTASPRPACTHPSLHPAPN